MPGDNCWNSEYDWGLHTRPGSDLPKQRKTVLCVLFEHGTQCQFSSVRITLCSKSQSCGRWKITSKPSTFSVDHVTPESEDTPTAENDPSLPICDVIFSANHQSEIVPKPADVRGELVLIQAGPGSLNQSFDKIVEFHHPLTKNTQSVSISFTSSFHLYTRIVHGDRSDSLYDRLAIVGRVVRILPVVPAGERRSIILPADILLLIFENLNTTSTHRTWRKDILSCALVCREWTCALKVLLIDFRSNKHQWQFPPDISNFANALVAHPNLAHDIDFLSARYFDQHPSWDPFSLLPSDLPAKVRAEKSRLRRSQFSKAFLSLLHVSTNLQTLDISPRKDLVIPPDELMNAFRGLSNLQSFSGRCPLTMAQLISCIAAWPSLKCLTILHVDRPSDQTLPLVSPSCCLTELELLDIQIKDDELACLVSASGATLKKLTLNRVSRLTNAGLRTTLDIVSSSLTYLYLLVSELARDVEEEYALDATITQLVRLTTLNIVPLLASERMLKRRADAFKQRTTPGLTVVHLHLMIARGSEYHHLVEASNCSWPGWTIK